MHDTRQEPGGGRDDTCDHDLFKTSKVEVCGGEPHFPSGSSVWKLIKTYPP